MRPLKNSNKQRQQQQQKQQKQQKQNPTAIHFFYMSAMYLRDPCSEFQGMKRAAGKDEVRSRRFQMNLDHPGWKLVKNVPLFMSAGHGFQIYVCS